MRVALLFACVALAASAAHAIPSFAQEIAAGKRLIQVNEVDAPIWMTEAEVEKLIHEDLIGFMDITDHPDQPKINHPVGTLAFPDQLFYQRVVAQITPRLSIPRMEAFIQEFATFNNRYYTAQTGRQSSEWLQDQVQAIIDEALANGYTGTVSVQAVTHTWIQNSVVARIEGSDPTQKTQVLILGAHQDSVNSGSPTAGNAPGADDDGSGCAVLIESFRALLESGFVPRRTVEFQWYAAEEVGLRGSQAIANDYNARGVDVVSMIQFDVVGYNVGRNEIGVITDFTTATANAFLRLIIDEYCTYRWTNLQCGYGCSDHASFFRAGFTTAMPVEVVFHPSMHTVRDIISTVNFDQVLEFAKLAVGHTVELALSVV